MFTIFGSLIVVKGTSPHLGLDKSEMKHFLTNFIISIFYFLFYVVELVLLYVLADFF